MQLPDSHPVWEITGHYLAALCANLVYTVSPSVIVIGGGVMNRDCLYDIIRKKTLELLNGYIKSPKLTPGIASVFDFRFIYIFRVLSIYNIYFRENF